ncbi:MAG TPA: fibronectin type III domain-containing protein [Candidatus Krumholzibacterium sp.]|nr:fibronectin type III domain-containing protein [Candidatus Krumholzibacterium sp.]
MYVFIFYIMLAIFPSCEGSAISPVPGDEIPENPDPPVPAVADTTAPSVPSGLTAEAVSSSSIELVWSASTDDRGVEAYRVYRGTTLAGTTAVTAWIDTGLQPETAYSYRVCAFDSAGNCSELSSPAQAVTEEGSQTGATYYVGPGRTYATLQDVAIHLRPGDLVIVDGGRVYPGGLAFYNSGTPEAPITIRGDKSGGSRPVIEGGHDVVEFNRDNYVFESFEIRNSSFRGLYHHADNITLRDCVVHHCPHGILGADTGSGDILIEYCEVYSCGEGDGRHQIYMSTNENDFPGSVFRMRFCYIHDGTGGNNVKSRAERNEIHYNWLENPYYHNLELIGPDPAGGVAEDAAREDSDVVGNVLIARRFSRNVRIGGDGCGNSWGRYRFVNNTFIHRCPTPASQIFAHFDVESVEMHNNVFYMTGGVAFDDSEADWVYGRRVSGSSNWVSSGRGYPGEWTATITGPDPGFADMAGNDFMPAAGSLLIGGGTTSMTSPDGSPFIDPLALPLYHPPVMTLIPVGTGEPRPSVGVVDIGAYEAPY